MWKYKNLSDVQVAGRRNLSEGGGELVPDDRAAFLSTSAIGSRNGLAPILRQTISWSKADKDL